MTFEIHVYDNIELIEIHSTPPQIDIFIEI